MARTTPELVAGIIEVDEDIDVAPFIEVANELVTELCAPPATAYSDGRLELIERWLAAHFYSVRDPRIQSEGVRGISTSYIMQISKYLAETTHGQQALALDTSGALARLNKQAETGITGKVSIGWLGTKRYT